MSCSGGFFEVDSFLSKKERDRTFSLDRSLKGIAFDFFFEKKILNFISIDLNKFIAFIYVLKNNKECAI
jgi:hypothetical protein